MPIRVDYENCYVFLGDYFVDPVIENGYLISYIVEDPLHNTHLVGDLDSFFRSVLPVWRGEP